MKNNWTNFLSLLNFSDKFIELSKPKRKMIIALLVFLFATTIYTILTYTKIIAIIYNIWFIAIVINYLTYTPLPLIIIIILSLFIIIWLLYFSKKDVIPFEEIDVEKLYKPDLSSNIFEITLANISSKNVILKELLVEWKYIPGCACSIGQSSVIKPVGKYIINIPIDVHNTTLQEMKVKMNPMITVPAKDKSGPGILQFIVQLHYDFIGKIDWHPCYDWDISYSLAVVDNKGRKYNIFYGCNWRCEEELLAIADGQLDEYMEKLKSYY